MVVEVSLLLLLNTLPLVWLLLLSLVLMFGAEKSLRLSILLGKLALIIFGSHSDDKFPLIRGVSGSIALFVSGGACGGVTNCLAS